VEEVQQICRCDEDINNKKLKVVGQCCPTFLYIGAHLTVEARAPCGDCNNNNNNNNNTNINNNNKVILIKIITDKNLTLTKRLIKKILHLHN
jgi:hypothetical protein